MNVYRKQALMQKCKCVKCVLDVESFSCWFETEGEDAFDFTGIK